MWASGEGNENDDISVIEESCVEVDPDFTEYMQTSHGTTATTQGTILTTNVPIQASSSGLGLTLATGVDLSDPKQLAELAKSKIQRVKPQVGQQQLDKPKSVTNCMENNTHLFFFLDFFGPPNEPVFITCLWLMVKLMC